MYLSELTNLYNKGELNMKKYYSIYDYMPEDYIGAIRILNGGFLPIARFTSEEEAIREAEEVVNVIEYIINFASTK